MKRSNRIRGLATVCGLLAGAAGLRGDGAQLILLTDAASALAAAALDVTPDGSVVVGTSGGSVFRWTEAGGSVLLSPPDPQSTFTAAVSDDGSVVVSGLLDPVHDVISPGRWTAAGGWTYLGCLPGVPPTPDPTPQCGTGYDVSGDGSTVVGLAWHGDTYRAEGFLWTAGGGMVGLGYPGSASSRASVISPDGQLVGGFYEHESWGNRRPVRWLAGGLPDLFLDPYSMGEVAGISADGSLLTGAALRLDENGLPLPPWTVQKGFVFSDAGGFRYLRPIRDYDDLGTELESMGNGVSTSGIVVGWSGTSGPWGQVFPALYCPGASHMVEFAQALAAAGATIPADILLTSAIAITPDASTIVGQAYDMTTFELVPYVARFAPNPCDLLLDGFETGDTSAWSSVQP